MQQIGNNPHEKVLRSIERFAKDVVPHGKISCELKKEETQKVLAVWLMANR